MKRFNGLIFGACLTALFLPLAHGETMITPDMVWTGKEKPAQAEEEKRRAAQKQKRLEIERDAEASRRAEAEREVQELKQALEAEKRKAASPVPKYTADQVFQDDLGGGRKGPEMVVIPAGRFTMGSPEGETGRNKDEGPQHEVGINAFAMGKTEVTQGQWKAVMGSNPSYFKDCGDNCPVEGVSWDDVQKFIEKLNAKTGKQYRLPSEAEWEYACRAGGKQRYCGGDEVDSVAWYDKNSGGKTHRVGLKRANAWGLYDMSGNVDEWVEDCLNANYRGAPVDGSASTSGDCSVRVPRGGSWYSEPALARSAYRGGYVMPGRYKYYGFRLARMLP